MKVIYSMTRLWFECLVDNQFFTVFEQGSTTLQREAMSKKDKWTLDWCPLNECWFYSLYEDYVGLTKWYPTK